MEIDVLFFSYNINFIGLPIQVQSLVISFLLLFFVFFLFYTQCIKLYGSLFHYLMKHLAFEKKYFVKAATWAVKYKLQVRYLKSNNKKTVFHFDILKHGIA